MDQELLNSVSSYTSKLLRNNFGKGPQSCQSIMNKTHFVTYIRGFISPMEEVLMNRGQKIEVEKARNFIINHLLDELKGVIQVSLNREVQAYYQDWNFPNNSGILMYTFEEDEQIERGKPKIKSNVFEAEIARISKLVQKIPDEITIYEISPSIFLVERKGILIPIEKALIKRGFEEELILTKDTLEKEYFHRYGKFDEIFQHQVKDIFIDWDLKNDKSLMAFILW
ncbi:Na-translocating system protein MpsC family protein [Bacillus salitolerans]|uniref:Na-translocating system protein MpsC family protein n=1 Tax=Bacillus salitolerans TaxID=1437434 RepID=A0ABW4LLZ0_9BACI